MKLMKQSLFTITFAAVLALILTACSGLGLTGVNFDVGGSDINPLQIDITTNPLTYDSTAQTLEFSSRAGALGVTIEGYDIEFYEASDNPAFPGDSIGRSSGSYNVYVPPGIRCDAPDDVLGCTMNDAGATYARGPAIQGPPTFLVDPDIAFAIFDLFGIGGAVGSYAIIYFYGTDDLQRPFRTDGFQFKMIII